MHCIDMGFDRKPGFFNRAYLLSVDPTVWVRAGIVRVSDSLFKAGTTGIWLATLSR